jgi:predicted nucleic acid-binding protein
VTKVVFLDAGPLSLLSTPPGKKGNAAACGRWLAGLLGKGVRVIVPEITDYEVRRELLRARKTKSVGGLDHVAMITEYLRLTTDAMRKAAELWAITRQAGRPTAGDKNIDADVILAAQAIVLGEPNTVIATTNIGHLSRFIAAEDWQLITA